jgi:hypothetical protein
MARKNAKDPLMPVAMRLPQSYVAKLNKAAASCGKSVSRTAVMKRLIDDGLKWWAREDLEQDTTLQMVAQMHERSATILAMQNVMARRLGLMGDEAAEAAFAAEVQAMKAQILKLTGGVTSDGVADVGNCGRVDADGDDGDDMADAGDGDGGDDDLEDDDGIPD